jgi:Leucine-rich repeat (LRR) protein
MATAVTDQIPPARRRFTIWLPRPLWIGLPTAVLLVIAIMLHVGLPMSRQQIAIREVKRLGGTVETGSRCLEWLRTFTGGQPTLPFEDVTWIGLAGTPATDATMVLAGRFTRLEWLILDGTRVTDAGLAELENLAVLEGLDLSNTQVTDAGLKHVQGLTRLQYLRLGGTQVTESAAAQLKRTLPRLTITGNTYLIE